MIRAFLLILLPVISFAQRGAFTAITTRVTPTPELVINNFQNLQIVDDVKYSPSNFVNLGRLAAGLVMTDIYYIKKDNNEEFFVIDYRDGQVVVFDKTHDTYNIYNTGFNKPWKPTYLESTNKLFIIANITKDFCLIDLTSHTISYTTTTGVTIPNPGLGGLQDRVIGTDGNLYIGGNIDATAYKYNPTNNQITTFPKLFDIPGKNIYTYFLGADANYLYALLRQSGNYWFVILNQTTNETTYISETADGYRAGEIKLFKDTGTNEKFWRLTLSSSTGHANIVKKFKDGVERPDLNTNVDLFDTEQFGKCSYNNYYSSFPARYGIDVDLNGITGLIGSAFLDYKLTSESNFTRKTFTGLNQGTDYELSTMEITEDGSLIGMFGLYGPAFKWDTTLDVLDQANNNSGMSGYSAKYINNKIYLGGYDNSTLEWTPENPWKANVNPLKINIGVSNALYHYCYAKAGDWLFIAQEKGRNDYGVAISAFNTVTREIINPDETLTAMLKEYNVGHMITMDGGNKLVFLTKPALTTIYPKVFVWDISSNKNINQTKPYVTEIKFPMRLDGYPLPGGYAIPYNDHIFYAFISNVIYRFDLNTRTSTYRKIPNIVSYGPFFNRPICQTPDGRVFWIGKPGATCFLYELDMATFTGIRRSSGLGVFTLYRALAATNDKIYFYGGYYNSSVTNIEGVTSQYFLEKLNIGP